MGEDQAHIMTCAAEDGVKGIAEGALEGRARQAAVGLHMADARLDGAAPAQGAPERAVRLPPRTGPGAFHQAAILGSMSSLVCAGMR